LARLEREGLFRSEVSGRQKYFHSTVSIRFLMKCAKIVAKTIGAAPVIGRSLKRIEGIDKAYLYGSFARNQQDAASDIDRAHDGAPREEALAQAMRRLERQLGRRNQLHGSHAKGIPSRAVLERMPFWKTSGTISVFRSWLQMKEAKTTPLTGHRSNASSRARTTSSPLPEEFWLFDEEACLQQAYEAMLKASIGFMFSHGFPCEKSAWAPYRNHRFCPVAHREKTCWSADGV